MERSSESWVGVMDYAFSVCRIGSPSVRMLLSGTLGEDVELGDS
jgi:hypothetical protein